MNVESLIAWEKCPNERVPVILQQEWNGFVTGLFSVPRDRIQMLMELQLNYRRCRNLGSSVFIDCDGDALLCRADPAQTDLWKHSWPNEDLPQPEMRTISLWRDGKRGAVVSGWEGLIPVITQDAEIHDVLMLAWVTPLALAEAFAMSRGCYFSRSREELWRKGEESGNVQKLREVFGFFSKEKLVALNYWVHQVGGAACHDGFRSCFYREITDEGLQVIGARVFDPKQVYGKRGV